MRVEDAGAASGWHSGGKAEECLGEPKHSAIAVGLAMTLLLTGTLAACGTESESRANRNPGRCGRRTPDAHSNRCRWGTPAPSGGASSTAPATGGQTGGQATTFEVDMQDSLSFQPSELTIPANTDVTIYAVNSGALPHTFTIKDVADTGEVAGGASADVKVNLPPGEYEFHCAIPGHTEAGMVGTRRWSKAVDSPLPRHRRLLLPAADRPRRRRVRSR